MSLRYYMTGLVLALHWWIAFLFGIYDPFMLALSDWPRWARMLLAADLAAFPFGLLLYAGHRLDKRRDARLRGGR